MSLHHLGETRSRRAHDHLLQTPDTFVWASLPGMVNATACVHAAPALSAGFAMYTAVLQPGGELGSTTHSRFLFVLEGSVAVRADDAEHVLREGGYAYLPPGTPHGVRSVQGARLVTIEKPFTPLAAALPLPIFGNEAVTESAPLLGDESVRVKALLPPDPAFDFAVNTMEYQPGARLPMVEVHVMEHGLLMLDGEGIYRLGDSWYPVQAGDFIWMGAFCPQWFGALGSQPARYLIYKDWNRHPLVQGQLSIGEVPR